MKPDYSLIKKYRKQAGLTQKELADYVDVSAAYIQQLENGIKTNPSLKLLYSISNVLNIPPREIFQDDDTEIYALASDRILNGILFKNIDFTKTNYVGSILENNNYEAVTKLLKDIIKIIMYVEDIQEECITNSVVDELRGLIIEFLTMKCKIYNLEGRVWESFSKKNAISSKENNSKDS